MKSRTQWNWQFRKYWKIRGSWTAWIKLLLRWRRNKRSNSSTTVAAIAAAIQEQSRGASEVNQHVVMIRDVTGQSGESAKQTEQMSEELSQQAQVLHTEVSRFTV